MSNVTNLKYLLLGGSITSPKSGAFIQNIHTVEDKGCDVYVIGGETIEHRLSGSPIVRDRWTTIELSNY